MENKPTEKVDIRERAHAVMDRIEKEIKHDATQWNGMLVWEASDADTLYAILVEALTQIQQDFARRVEEVIEKTIQEERFSGTPHALNVLKEAITKLL